MADLSKCLRNPQTIFFTHLHPPDFVSTSQAQNLETGPPTLHDAIVPILPTMSSGSSTPASQSTFSMEDLSINSSLEDLQTDEQRRVLDTVAKVRKCGLEGILSLPQLVVCGDQSAGKSSVCQTPPDILPG